ncbi:hypothetical protein HYH03_002993 [Edaphochlamys debaryana]|uniref:RAP domain-containing protein n=1 Tax=Edaphochlamys debaryana TaxID=47281 RepID=A0A835YJH0_9CHLO|nr:hypothetical protein HYH03_002993 [Edaphochlamys debaryana]|eukprot:KAG2498799.1 hypothetical protein HYH03_002993 [Edaphochlamys debaryana]
MHLLLPTSAARAPAVAPPAAGVFPSAALKTAQPSAPPPAAVAPAVQAAPAAPTSAAFASPRAAPRPAPQPPAPQPAPQPSPPQSREASRLPAAPVPAPAVPSSVPAAQAVALHQPASPPKAGAVALEPSARKLAADEATSAAAASAAAPSAAAQLAPARPKTPAAAAGAQVGVPSQTVAQGTPTAAHPQAAAPVLLSHPLASGAAGVVAEAASEPAPPPARPRVPAALLPLTLQGRVARMEAALAARRAAEAAKAPAPATPAAAAASTPAAPASAHARPSSQTPARQPLDRSKASPTKAGQAAPPSTPTPLPRQRTPKPARAASAGHAAASASASVGASAPPVRLRSASGAAVSLFKQLSAYTPAGREDSRVALAPFARYHVPTFQAAAEATAAAPSRVLQRFSFDQIASVAAAYAAAGHRHEPFLAALAAAAAGKLVAAPPGQWQQPSRRRQGLRLRRSAAAAAAAPPSFRGACVLLMALSRLGGGAAAPTATPAAAVALWIAKELASGRATPRSKRKGTWLAAALASYPQLERQAAAAAATAVGGGGTVAVGGGGGGSGSAAVAAAELAAAGRILFAEAAEAIRVDPGWIYLLDGREALWALWAFRAAADSYGAAAAAAPPSGSDPDKAAGTREALTAAVGPALTVARSTVGRYDQDPLVEIKLAGRAASMVEQFSPAHLAEAYALVAEAGLRGEAELLAALRAAALARAASLRPQPLAVMAAALAVMGVRDLVWLTGLAAAARNKMVNTPPHLMAVTLHSLAGVLRLRHPPLMRAAALVATAPGFERLRGLGPGEVVRLAGAYAAVGSYEGMLLRRAAEHMLSLGPGATPWQRAALLTALTRLGHRNSPLLRAVAAEVLGLSLPGPSLSASAASASVSTAAAASSSPAPSGTVGANGAVSGQAAGMASAAAAGGGAAAPPALVVAVAAAAGALQFRPPGLLPALAAAGTEAWTRLGLPQRATLAWAQLVLMGPLVPLQLAPAAAAAAAAAVAAATPTATTLLSEYVRCLGVVSPRQWPSGAAAAAGHHRQLLTAAAVLCWLGPAQRARGGGPAGSVPASVTAEAVEAGLTEADAGRRELRSELRRLPAGSLAAALAEQQRARMAELGPWAAAAAAVAEEAVALAAAATAATSATSASAVFEVPASGGGGGRARQRSARQGRVRLTLAGGRVAAGMMVAGGALGVDVALDLDLEVELEGLGSSTAASFAVVDDLAGAGSAEAAAAAGPSNGQTEGEAPQKRWRRLRVALELCRMPGADSFTALGASSSPGGGGSSSGGGGGDVPLRPLLAAQLGTAPVTAPAPPGQVRNSRWLLSGGAAMRRRLLAALGWRVVAVREKEWAALRSREQRRREAMAWLRRVLAAEARALTAEVAAAEAEAAEAPAGGGRAKRATRKGAAYPNGQILANLKGRGGCDLTWSG